MTPIEYDSRSHFYYTEIDGCEVWSESHEILQRILHRLDEREARREDARATGTAFILAAVVLIAAAVVAAWL